MNNPSLLQVTARVALSLLIADDMIVRRELKKRKKQVTYLIDMINKNGGVQDEFDKLALIELGLVIGPEPANTDK
jgi:hypothetical protein